MTKSSELKSKIGTTLSKIRFADLTCQERRSVVTFYDRKLIAIVLNLLKNKQRMIVSTGSYVKYCCDLEPG